MLYVRIYRYIRVYKANPSSIYKQYSRFSRSVKPRLFLLFNTQEGARTQNKERANNRPPTLFLLYRPLYIIYIPPCMYCSRITMVPPLLYEQHYLFSRSVFFTYLYHERSCQIDTIISRIIIIPCNPKLLAQYIVLRSTRRLSAPVSLQGAPCSPTLGDHGVHTIVDR